MFEQSPNIITNPIEMERNICIEDFNNETSNYLNQVFTEEIRLIIFNKERPVVAIVPLVDIEMLKDVQLDTEPCKWIEWVQNIRERLGMKAVLFNDMEDSE